MVQIPQLLCLCNHHRKQRQHRHERHVRELRVLAPRGVHNLLFLTVACKFRLQPHVQFLYSCNTKLNRICGKYWYCQDGFHQSGSLPGVMILWSAGWHWHKSYWEVFDLFLQLLYCTTICSTKYLSINHYAYSSEIFTVCNQILKLSTPGVSQTLWFSETVYRQGTRIQLCHVSRLQ